MENPKTQAECYKIRDIGAIKTQLNEAEISRAYGRTNEAFFNGEGLTLMEAMQDELAERIRTLAER